MELHHRLTESQYCISLIILQQRPCATQCQLCFVTLAVHWSTLWQNPRNFLQYASTTNKAEIKKNRERERGSYPAVRRNGIVLATVVQDHAPRCLLLEDWI